MNPTAPPGPPIAANVAKYYRARAKGFKTWIHTARPNSDYELVESWFDFWGIPLDGIETGKPLFYRYIDDRAINADREEGV